MAMFLSLEINNSIKIIEASKKGITLSVLSCMTIDGSCVMDGRILDMDRTVNVINEALNNKGIKTGKAIFIINSSRIMIRRIKLPLLKKKQEILSMLQIELQQEVRTDLSKYMILYDVADITKDKKIAYAQYVAYCVPEELVNDCHELAVRLKLKSLKINNLPQTVIP
jgi:type IV pilus assembly protein PilM